MINRLIDVALSHRELRTLQDWFIRYQLKAVPGVAEVASVGGVVVARTGVIDAVKARIAQIAPGLPQGVRGVMDWWQGHEDSSICC